MGFGTDEATGMEFYLVKNDFGTQWGEQGYVRIEVTDGLGTCGINTTP